MSYYVGFDLERTALIEINRALATDCFVRGEKEYVRPILPGMQNDWRRVWRSILEVEKLQAMNFMGRVYQVNGDGDVRYGSPLSGDTDEAGLLHRIGRAGSLYWALSMPPRPEDIAEIVDQRYMPLEAMAESNYRMRPGWSTRAAQASMDNAAKIFSNFYRWMFEQIALTDDDARMFYAAYARQVALRRVTQLILALDTYKEVRGGWPESLELVWGMAPAEAFVDPISGDYFVYRVFNGEFELYSRGFNGIDEGGINRSGYLPEEQLADDIMIWPGGY
jgi:hypothetical protein